MVRKFANFLLFLADYNSGKDEHHISSDDSLFCTPEEEPDMEVGLFDYLMHLYRNFEVDNEYSAMIIPQAYICKLTNTDQFTFTRRNMHRVTLTAIVISVKMYDDKYADNAFYSEVGMLDLWELNKMESALLKKLDWKLMIPELAMVLIRS